LGSDRLPLIEKPQTISQELMGETEFVASLKCLKGFDRTLQCLVFLASRVAALGNVLYAFVTLEQFDW
jgi:hypothetical protein